MSPTKETWILMICARHPPTWFGAMSRLAPQCMFKQMARWQGPSRRRDTGEEPRHE